MKNCQRGHPILGFISFLLISLLIFARGGAMFTLPPPSLPPLCASMNSTGNGIQMELHIGETLHKKNILVASSKLKKFEGLWQLLLFYEVIAMNII